MLYNKFGGQKFEGNNIPEIDLKCIPHHFLVPKHLFLPRSCKTPAKVPFLKIWRPFIAEILVPQIVCSWLSGKALSIFRSDRKRQKNRKPATATSFDTEGKRRLGRW